MTCYCPRIRIEDTSKWEIAKDGHRYHPAKIEQPTDLPNRLEQLKDNLKYRYQIIPCGQCIGCRLDYSREWANRGYLESKCWEQNWFITLTYDEDHLYITDEMEDENGITFVNDGEWKGCLVPKDWTQFMKNLRQIMKRDYNQKNIRFMACGEYGEDGERPHMHGIIFNMNLPVKDLYHPRIINNEVYYQSHILERAWNKGISNISECTWNTIAYTARYITKKINGPESSTDYAQKGQIKEFFRVSRMPGIGEQYFREHMDEIYTRDEIIIKNKAGVVSSKPPKYFDYLYEQLDPEGFENIKAKRKKEAIYQNRIKDEKTSLFRLEQLQIEMKTNEEKYLKLVRAMEQGRQ